MQNTLHHAALAGFSTIVVDSPDTDVAVLLICANNVFKTGSKNKTRYVDMSHISERLGVDFCKALPGMHALTGCNSTGAFVGRGKKKAFELLSNSQQTMSRIGSEFQVSDELYVDCEKCAFSIVAARRTPT